MRLLLSLICLALPVASIVAQEAPIVRATVVPAEVAVGEPLRLQVTVLVPTWFVRPPEFPSFELPNAVVRLPPDSSRPTSERIGGDTWSGITRNYRIFPLVGANYVLDELKISVDYANPGSSPSSATVAIPPVRFSAVVPSGAEGLSPYLAGRSLRLDRQFDGDMGSLAVGDAITVMHVVELDGLPAIFLPPLFDIVEMPGVAAYANTPSVEDGVVSRRSESVTYVFETGGAFTVPPVQLRWWNTDTSTIETATLPEISLDVAGPAFATVASGPDAESRNWLSIAVLGTIATLVILLLPRLLIGLRQQYLEYATKRKNSEAYRFGEVRKALRRKEFDRAYAQLLSWAQCLDPPRSARSFTAECGSSELDRQIDLLSRQRHARTPLDVDTHALERALVSARRRCFLSKSCQGRAAIPDLNP